MYVNYYKGLELHDSTKNVTACKGYHKCEVDTTMHETYEVN